jgi:hypothetical protein
MVVGVLNVGTVLAADVQADTGRTIDPYDYSYCGGEPVYPVIGVNFSTFCGPRNQIGLGRRGSLFWLFSANDGRTSLAQGRRQLSTEQLARLSMLAEVVQLADATPPPPGPVNYYLGINFSGRPYKRMHGVESNVYTPANELFHAMLSLVPDAPRLPPCASKAAYFDPTLLPDERQPLRRPEPAEGP